MATETAPAPVQTGDYPGPEDGRDWYFTFGIGHRLYTGLRDRENIGGTGVELASYYVVIYGDFSSARQQMCDLFGRSWSNQYARLPTIGDLPGAPVWKELLKIPQPGD